LRPFFSVVSELDGTELGKFFFGESRRKQAHKQDER